MQQITLEPKQPYEIVPYTFDWSDFISTDNPIAAIAFGIYLATDNPSSPTLIPGMIYSTAYSAQKSTCGVGSGADAEGTYIIRARATTTSPAYRYEQEGVFVVKEI